MDRYRNYSCSTISDKNGFQPDFSKEKNVEIRIKAYAIYQKVTNINWGSETKKDIVQLLKEAFDYTGFSQCEIVKNDMGFLQNIKQYNASKTE